MHTDYVSIDMTFLGERFTAPITRKHFDSCFHFYRTYVDFAAAAEQSEIGLFEFYITFEQLFPLKNIIFRNE